MDNDNKPGSGLSMFALEAVVSVMLFVFGAVVVYDSHRLGSSWGSDGPQSGYFPFYIGLIVCISAVVIFYQNVAARQSRRGELFVERGQLRLVLMVLLPAAVYVLVIQLIGIYVASAVYIAGFMVVFGRYAWIKAALLALVVSASLFVMFEVWFKVPLYKGYWNPLGFLGY